MSYSCCKDRAVDMFRPLGVQVVTGHRYLGGFIGSKDGLQGFTVYQRRFISGSNCLQILLSPSHNWHMLLLLDHCSMNGFFY